MRYKGSPTHPAFDNLRVRHMYRKIIKTTPFGSVGIIWTGFNSHPKIIQILLSKDKLSAEDRASQLYPNASASSCPEIDAVAFKIKGLLEGDDIAISLDVADLGVCSAFQQSVLRAEYGIPRGRVSAYGLIAEHIGKHNGARAVGTALARNPFPLIVPCHRAIRSDRRLGGFQNGVKMKQALLEMEGVSFDDAGRVVCDRLHYERVS